MGELIIRKVRGMNWKAKISLILVFAMILSTFMYQGWYKPKFIEAAPTADGRIVYSINTTTPQHRAYTGSSNTFAAAAAMQTGVAQTFMVDRAAPTRNEHIAGYVTATGVLYIQRWNGSTWSAEWGPVTVGGNGVNGRRFDIAYEQTTGNAMVVYSNNTTGANELRYNIWNGSTWSGATIMDSARLTGTPTSIKLTSQKVSGSNKIAATILDSGSILTTLIWSGSTWGNEPAAAHGTLAGTAGQNDLFDHAYESLSGDLFVVFTTSTPQQNYRIFTDSSSTWGVTTSYGTSRAAPLQMLATPDPQSDKILVMFNRSASAFVYARIWNGSADGNASTFVITGVTTAINKKTIAGKWLVLDGTSYAVAMTATTTAGTIGYGYFNGTAWTTAQTYATGVATTAQWMDCDSDPLGLDTMMLTYSDGSNDLYARRLVLTSGPTFTFTDPVGGALIAALGSITSQNFSFAYDQTKPPTLTTPTATTILDTTATLGANVTSDNGSTITERGTVWNTTGTPTTADNKTITTGTTGVFTTNVSSITAGTKIYYRGYAINGIGTGYSPQGSFYTEPATQASGVSFTNVGCAGMTVNWTRGSGDGVIVLMKSGSAVTGTPSDGTYATYNANTAFGSGTLIGDGYVVYKGTGTSVDVTALSGSTAYYVAVYEYSGVVDNSGNDLGTNYKLTPATGNQTTAVCQTITVGDATSPSNKNVYRNDTNKAVSAFTLQLTAGSGTATVSQLVVTGTASAGSSQTETSSVKIYKDNNADREWDAGDTLVATTTFSTNTATFSGLSIPVTTTLANYIIVYDINAAATATRTLTASVTSATHNADLLTNNDNADATLTITSQTLTYGNGAAEPSAKTVYRGETNKALDTFTLSVNGGTATVTQIVVTSTTSAGSGQTEASAVKIYQDNGSTANEWDSGDTLISSTTFATNTATFSGLSIPVTTSSVSYIITIDVNTTATAARTITAQISALTSYAQTNTDSDTGGATLTIGSNTLTVGEGTNPASRIVMQGSTNEAVGAFTLQTSVGSTLVSQIVITGTNPSNVQSGGVKLWEDNGTVGTWDGADVQVGSGVTFSGTTATFSGLTIQPTTSLKNYIVTYNIAEKATIGGTVTGYISGITATANTTNNNDNNVDATLTIKGSSVTVSCGSCHAYPPTDGSRNNPIGAVVGDHQPHNYVCSTCHVTPATETSADYGHRNGNIQMKAGATGISSGYYDKNNNAAYNAGVDDIFLQTNTPTTSVCRNISCHGANNPTPQWGVGTATCVDCHNGTITRTMAAGTLDNVVAEFGLAWGHKSSGRGAVTASDCIVCHLEGNYSTQRTSATYHANGNIDLRDPDGAGETAITNIAGGAFTFQKFATSYAAGSRTTTGHTSNNIDNVLTQKFCLACHDSDGATNATARTAGGTAAMPFGGVALGANYTAANGAIGTQGLINVNSQFATSNSSRHPVLGPLNKDYATAARLNDPYKPTGTRGTSGTLSQGVVINCFDCHNAPTVLTDRTVAAHGNAVTLRGQPVAHNAGTPITTTPAAANEPSLCKVCHAGYDTQTIGYHGTGSAWYLDDRDEHIDFMRWGCNKCHSSNYDTVVVRPVRALDNHGVNVLPSGGLAKTGRWSTQGTPIAFIRNTVQLSNHQPRVAGGTTFTASCTGMAGNLCASSRTETYTIGGTY